MWIQQSCGAQLHHIILLWGSSKSPSRPHYHYNCTFSWAINLPSTLHQWLKLSEAQKCTAEPLEVKMSRTVWDNNISAPSLVSWFESRCSWEKRMCLESYERVVAVHLDYMLEKVLTSGMFFLDLRATNLEKERLETLRNNILPHEHFEMMFCKDTDGFMLSLVLLKAISFGFL